MKREALLVGGKTAAQDAELAILGQPFDFDQQSAFADPGIAADEDQLAFAGQGQIEPSLDFGNLLLPPDQGLAGMSRPRRLRPVDGTVALLGAKLLAKAPKLLGHFERTGRPGFTLFFEAG